MHLCIVDHFVIVDEITYGFSSTIIDHFVYSRPTALRPTAASTNCRSAVELFESSVATGAMLRSFSQTALPTRVISISILYWLDGARTPHKVLPIISPLWQKNGMTNQTTNLSN
jgi:hypothetical protein